MSKESIFQEGDVVYHFKYGKGTVCKYDALSKNMPFVNFEDGTYCICLPEFLSFSEWPAPNHIRPLKNGVYKVEYGGEHWVMCFYENVWYFVDSYYTTMIGKEVGAPYDVKNPEFLYSI